MTLFGMKRNIDNLKREVAMLRPSFSAGSLTSYTTRGVMRSVVQNPSQSTSTNNTSVKARWA